MSNTSSKLDSIAQAKAKLLDELQKLEEQEKTERASEASSAHAAIVSLLEQFAGHFNTKQRNDIAAYLGTSAARKNVVKSGRSEVKPKYELPHTGETWSGRGRTPRPSLPGKARCPTRNGRPRTRTSSSRWFASKAKAHKSVPRCTVGCVLRLANRAACG